MVSGGITEVNLSKSKIDLCGVCSLRLKANLVLCVQCGMCMHDGCVGVKMVTSKC